MAKIYIRTLLMLALFALIISCAAQIPKKTIITPLNVTPKLETGQYVQDADILYVILDASSSVPASEDGRSDINLAKNIVSRMNHTMPDITINAALRAFGLGECLYNKDTRLLYGVTRYSRDSFQKSLDSVTCVANKSPMEIAINAANEDLKPSEGKIALVIVSDGVGVGNGPIIAAENIKDAYGDRICIYTVLTGNSYEGETLMTKIAKVGGCGDMVREGDIAAKKDMAKFVERVLFAMASDSDLDGVKDDLDQCPGTPRGMKVDSKGCPLDTDGDGVYDDKDQCPGTPAEAKVNAVGCWVLKNVTFDTDKWNIKPSCYSDLHEVLAVLTKNPSLSVDIQGHTDSLGNVRYNQSLSQKRANEVMNYLVGKGIAKDRLTAVGYGVSKPVASNKTVEGRAQNRRVELSPVR